MEILDRRMGFVRRGVTPTAPKPINLPSQKLENQALVPDVEIVPRGTFVWGRAPNAGSKCIEKSESASLPSEDNVEIVVLNEPVPADELQGMAEKSSPTHPVESDTSFPSSIDCIGPREKMGPSCSSGSNVDCNSNVQVESRSPIPSDESNLSLSIAQQSSESLLVASATVHESKECTAKVEDQRQPNSFVLSTVDSWTEGSEKVSNLQSEQSIDCGSKLLPDSQGFCYFGDFYSNLPFSRPGVSFTNSQGMACETGMYPDSFKGEGLYSSLGVPYYDSNTDREIVVVTMVGNPGVYGNYPPYPGFADQYGGGTGVYGNFPLQFGHFKHFLGPGHGFLDGVPQVSSGEEGDYACYEQAYYQDGWDRCVNGCSFDGIQYGNMDIQMQTPFSTFKPDVGCQNYSIPRRTGRPKSAYRRKRAFSTDAFIPERRVTLLTKVSQHEVMISNVQGKSRKGGNCGVEGLRGSPNFAQISSCEVRCDLSAVGGSVHAVMDTETSQTLDVSKGLSERETLLPQVESDTVKMESSISCNNDSLQSNLQTLAASTTPTSEPQGESALQHQSTLFVTPTDQLPVALKAVAGNVGKLKHEIRHVTFNIHEKSGELQQDAPLKQPAATPETSSTMRNEALPLQCKVERVQGYSNYKNNRKWKCQLGTVVAKLGVEHFLSKVQEVVNDCKVSPLVLSSNHIKDAVSIIDADSPPACMTKPNSQCSTTFSSHSQGGVLIAEEPGASKEKPLSAPTLNCDCLSQNAKARPSEISGLDTVAALEPVTLQEGSNKSAIRSTSLRNSQRFPAKEWRPKPSGTAYEESASKASRQQLNNINIVCKASGLEANEPQNACSSTNYNGGLKVFFPDRLASKFKHRQSQVWIRVDNQNTTAMKLSASVIESGSNADAASKDMRNCPTLLSNNGNEMKLIGKEKLQQPRSLAIKHKESKYMHTGGTPTGEICASSLGCNEALPSSTSMDTNTVSALPLKEKLKQSDSPSNVIHPVFESPTIKVNMSSKSWLQHSSEKIHHQQDHEHVKNMPEVKEVTEKDQPAVSLPISSVSDFGTKSLRGNNSARERRHPMALSTYSMINEKGNFHERGLQQFQFEEVRSFEAYPVKRLQHQKLWKVKGMPLQVQPSAIPCVSSASCSLWKQKQSLVVQGPKRASTKEGENKNLTPLSESKKTSRESLVSTSSALLSKLCGNGQQGSDRETQECLKPVSEAAEECLVVAVSGSDLVSPSTSSGSEQQVNNTRKYSYKAALEMQCSAHQGHRQEASVKASPSKAQVVLGPVLQAVSLPSTPLKSEDSSVRKAVKLGQHYRSWRPKVVAKEIATIAAFCKEVNENDPSASVHVEVPVKQQVHVLSSRNIIASRDLHVWRNNGRRSIRASYGLPFWNQELPQQRKGITSSPRHNSMFHVEGSSAYGRVNKKAMDQEIPRGSRNVLFAKEVKHASPHKEAEILSPRENLGPFKHLGYAVKQADWTCSEQSLVRRPFSTKSNFSCDDNKKVVHHQQQFLSRAAVHMRQGKSKQAYSTRESVHGESQGASRYDFRQTRRWVVKTETSN